MPARGGVGQIHRDLGVLDPPGGAGVLALHPDRMHALLHVAGFVDDQDRAGVTEGVDDVVTQIITDRIGVPSGPRQQMLQPVGSGIAAVLGDRPAILAVQTRDHPEPSTHRHDAAVRSGRNAARSDRSPPRTQSTTDQGLRYEPRRPRPYSDVFTNSEQCRGHRPYQRRHATTHQSRTTAAVLGAWVSNPNRGFRR